MGKDKQGAGVEEGTDQHELARTDVDPGAPTPGAQGGAAAIPAKAPEGADVPVEFQQSAAGIDQRVTSAEQMIAEGAFVQTALVKLACAERLLKGVSNAGQRAALQARIDAARAGAQALTAKLASEKSN